MIRRSERGMIDGIIRDETNDRPLYDVNVSVEGSTVKTRTDIRGRFTIPNLPSGTCKLICEKAGYRAPASFNVNVVPERITRCECRLTPKSTVKLDEPVVLLPLRLEIRKHFPQANVTDVIAGYAAEERALPIAAASSSSPFAATSVHEAHSGRASEYWIRWYPDHIHHLSPVGKITGQEKESWQNFYLIVEKHESLGTVKGLYEREPFELSLAQLEIFYGMRPGRLSDEEIARCRAYDKDARGWILEESMGFREVFAWREMDNPEIKAAWIELCREHGTVRARQIAKHMREGNWDFDQNLDEEEPMEFFMDEGMPIPTLPEEISIFTVRNGLVQPVIENIAINREELIIAPTDLKGALWMTDFKIAIQVGMGTIIKDPEKVKQIDLAEWLIVVGLNETAESRTVLEEILRRNNANGELAILAQDAPTSNSEESSTSFTDLNVEAENYLTATRMKLQEEPSTVDPAVQINKKTLDSQRLTWLLRLDQDTLSEIPNAQLSEMTEAAAMAALLWIPCTHLFEEIKTPNLQKLLAGFPSNLRRASLGEFFLNNVRARGTFPILRVEENPYGILPVISLRDWCTHSERRRSSAPSGDDLLCSFINSWKSVFLKIAEEVPKVGAADDDIYEELLEVLRHSPVSKRVDVREFDSKKPLDMSADAQYLDCALVKDKAEEGAPIIDTPYPETAYLYELRNANQSDFNWDAVQIDGQSPLLKRLIHFYLGLIRPKKKKPVGSLRLPEISSAMTASPLTGTITDDGGTVGTSELFEMPGGIDLIAEAAALLGRVPPDKLEILLVESLDLFSHRLDAWITGLAHKRLQDCLAEPGNAPPTGVYGWLENPGNIGEASAQPEFIQAPSVKQAITSAILRNASIHNGTADNSGAFQINLSSEQVRKGLWYMEGLRQGHLPGELLGYRLERMIHEEAAKNQSPVSDPDPTIRESDVFKLRDEYPLSLRDTADQGTPPSSLLTVIDGEKFLNNNLDGKFKDIRARLNQFKDAAADIALSEVTHADDNIARRGGWLDFLEGDSLPPKEEFVASVRTGDIHGTKIFLLVPTPQELEIDETITNPRIIADPLLAAYCEKLMPDFRSKEIVAELSTKDGSMTRQTTFLVQELNMDPIDLVIGGLEEFILRSRYHLLSRWRSYDPNDSTSVQPFHILGEFPDFATTDELLNEMRVQIIPPASTQDAINVYNYLHMAREIRELLHRNRSKNSAGTVHPDDLPILSQDQQENVDHDAGIALLSRRLAKIGEMLVDLITRTITVSSELNRKHLILLELRHTRNRVKAIKDELLTPDADAIVAESINGLRVTLTNLSAMDQDFKALAQGRAIWDQIVLVETDVEHMTDHLDTLANISAELELGLELFLENTAQDLVAASGPLLFDMSQFGLEKALALLPDAPTILASQKILKLFEQLLIDLIDRLNPILPDAHPLKDVLQILKVVYIYSRELNQILLRHGTDPAGLENQLRSQLPLTLSQSQYISALSFSNFNYFDPLLDRLTVDLNNLFTSLSLTADIEQSFAAPNEKTAELISRLQALTDKEAMTILTPYLLAKENGHIPEWELNFSQLSQLNGPTYIKEYEEIRPAVRNLYKIFDLSNELTVFEDKYFQRVDPLSPATVKEGNTDFLYLTMGEGSNLQTKYLTVLLVDQWQEGIPNPDQSETTGIALRYPTPPAEAPNAVIVAVPPNRSKSESWTASILANTLLETIELMQIRMVSSEAVTDYLIKLPALLFPPDKSGGPLFPSKERLLHDFDVGATGGYVLATQLSPKQLSSSRAAAIRNEAPDLEENNEFE